MWLNHRFCCADLYGGRILSPERGHAFECWLIVEREDDADFIRRQLTQLSVAGCQRIALCGAAAARWHRTGARCVRAERLDVFSDRAAFLEALSLALRSRPFVPTDEYLFYDDEAACDEALRALKLRRAGRTSDGGDVPWA